MLLWGLVLPAWSLVEAPADHFGIDGYLFLQDIYLIFFSASFLYQFLDLASREVTLILRGYTSHGRAIYWKASYEDDYYFQRAKMDKYESCCPTYQAEM